MFTRVGKRLQFHDRLSVAANLSIIDHNHFFALMQELGNRSLEPNNK